eukprot:5399355-Pyramimonas_sp.AAC.1
MHIYNGGPGPEAGASTTNAGARRHFPFVFTRLRRPGPNRALRGCMEAPGGRSDGSRRLSRRLP